MVELDGSLRRSIDAGMSSALLVHEHRDFQSAGVRLYIFLGNGDPIRGYDQLRQWRSSHFRDSLIAVKPTFLR
jgi:hypothetical protein